MSKKIKSICIIGGGSAGASAALLYQTWLGPLGIKVTQIENVVEGPIGVGEATVGHINAFLKLCDINPMKFMLSKCDATVKYAVRLRNFRELDHSYFTPVATYSLDTSTAVNYKASEKEFWDSWAGIYFGQEGKSPFLKRESWNDCGYAIWPEFAWNVDAKAMAKEFKKLALDRGLEIIDDNITSLEFDENKQITAINLEKNGTNNYDFYIDCSGFKRLIPNSLNIPDIDYTDLIPNNRAWATQIPYEDRDKELPYLSSVDCVGLSSGWRWSIGQQSRLGTGYVFSSDFISEEDAFKEFQDSYPGRITKENSKLIKFKTHQSTQHAGPNWILSGLNAGFVEPLESTSIFIGHATLVATLNLMINNTLPNETDMVRWDPWEMTHAWEAPRHGEQREYTWNDNKTKVLNLHVHGLFDTTVKYILAHYVWSKRDDTPYWKWFKKHEEQTMIWAKYYCHDWTSHHIFGPLTWGLLAYANNKWEEVTGNKFLTYLWQNPQYRAKILSGEKTFEEISASVDNNLRARYEAFSLGKAARRSFIYKKHAQHALDLVNQEEFADIVMRAIKTGDVSADKLNYQELLHNI